MNALRAKLAALVLTALALSSCTVDPFCLTCVEKDAAVRADGGSAGTGAAGGGTTDGGGDRPDAGPDAGEGMVTYLDGGKILLPDGAVIPDPAKCTVQETCNGKDDDCDDEIDEDFDLARDPNNCGGCDTECAPEHAFGACRAGKCEIAACDVGAYDINEDVGDGCEYKCLPVDNKKDTICDRRDDDCDDRVDEDVAFDTDGQNCGECNVECVLNNASAVCTAGQCAFAGCDPGFVNADGNTDNGCELFCTPANPAVETCNLRDDDCDGTVDEGDPEGGGACGSGVGECRTGTEHCVSGRVVCEGGVSPTTETCNDKDDDCNGVKDNGNPEGGKLCGPMLGVCTRGREACVGGTLTCDLSNSVTATDEVCDGLDNDCDGTVDDGNPGGGVDCGSDVGECEFGTATCTGGKIECVGGVTVKAELCNGKDDNCDGVIDDHNPQGGGPCGISTGECAKGTWQCMGGQLVCPNDIEPAVEVCDGLDNDCDGSIDNGVPTNGACGDTDGECGLVPGVFTCLAGGYVCVGDRRPVDEKCNNKDDDCDGNVDEGNPEGGSTCGSGTGECVKGTEVCENGQLVCPDDVEPVAETCDGFDNDCNGVIDNGLPTNGDCGLGGDTGECTFGALTCVGGRYVCVGGIRPADELCNGKDDDCDEATDEGNPQGGQLCGIATGECVKGHQQCIDGALVCPDDVEPVAEVCDGLDNDCDGSIDDGVATQGACPGKLGVCGANPGLMTCVGGSYVCVGGAKPSIEQCDNLDNDCDGTKDEDLSRACGTNTGECNQGVEMCQDGGWVGCSAVTPITELCDGKDNDCNGAIDNGVATQGACTGKLGVCAANPGSMTCVNGAYTCVGGALPSTEVCDNLDNDCDGQKDEGLSRACGTNTGECNQGMEMCQDGAWMGCSAVTPITELCDGLDNDCNGAIDNGVPTQGACTGKLGVCAANPGVMTCVNGAYTCVGGALPSTEVCDNLDNDCDGQKDEGLSRACGTNTGECNQGVEMCQDGGWVGCTAVAPVTETCDGLDNDCNGAIDNGVPTQGACAGKLGVCATDPGLMTCVNGAYACVGGLKPTPELCDDLDNDCDGSKDENLQRACGINTGECSQGLESCSSGAWIGCTAVTPIAESCDGKDNDCDGTIDNDNPGGGTECGTDVGLCEFGGEVCQNGGYVCVGGTTPQDEVCDGLDNDCDGVDDNGDPGGGATCGSDVGRCSAGTTSCVAGAIECLGTQGPFTETCNGLDDDCDGAVDDNNPDGGGNCGIETGECSFGTQTCQGGTLVCVGGIVPLAEACDSLDNDCDGATDETFSFATDVNHCGNCATVCTVANGTPNCTVSGCGIAACQPGFFDEDGVYANGCEYACDFAGTEICNGADDDCDGDTDEELSVPTTLCNPNGVCGATEATCAGATGWECNYTGAFEADETTCDDLDNDCDGATDEGFPELGVLCSNGTGGCKRNGVFQCNAAGDDVECNAPAAGTPEDELCDNIDNDCDDEVDERVADDTQTPWRDGIDETAIERVLVDRAGGGFMEIMAYEASRPDATDSAQGTVGGYACSNPDTVPWTNVTWLEASLACCGLNSTGACPGALDTGMWRLCEAPDWQSACEGPSGTCDHSYTSGCTASHATYCNGDEYDCNPNSPSDQDCLMNTGDPAFPMCGTSWGSAGVVYDLSGNAKEWTATETAPSSGIYQMRGGSYMNIEAGRTCDFDFVVAPSGYAHMNTGFRCCFY